MPLYYVIQLEPWNIAPVDVTEDDEIIYNIPNTTCTFTIDDQTAHHTLDDLKIGPAASDCINTHRHQINGSDAWIALC